jgi:hypothetical protein
MGSGFVIFGLVWTIRRRIAPILFLGAMVFFGSTAAINARVFVPPTTHLTQPRPTTPKTTQPPFLYIVLDEAMGVGGLAMAPGGEALASDIRSLAERHRFRLYERAFSRHFVSGRSIPNILNFDTHDNGYGAYLPHSQDGKVGSRLFASLSAKGYEVVSYGTQHIDFCFPEAARCEVMPSFDPYSPYIGDDDPKQPLTHSRSPEMKSLVVYFFARQVFIDSYVVYKYLDYLSSLHTMTLPTTFYAVDAYEFPKWFDRFADDVAGSPRGRAYFAHLLMPHAPYVFDSNCLETGRAPVGYFMSEQYGFRGQALDHERANVYAAYYQQYRCALSRVDRLLTRLDALPQFKDATIVVEGDHGSRISAGMYVETVSDRDIVDNYPALYAIRGPGIEAGSDLRKTSVQRLTAEYFSHETPAQLGPDDLTIVIDSTTVGNVVVRPMPDFGDARRGPRSPSSVGLTEDGP